MYLHRGDGGGRTGVSGEGRERSLSARLLHICVRLASREVRANAGRERRSLRDDLRAVDHVVHIVTQSGERGEDELEVLLKLGLVV